MSARTAHSLDDIFSALAHPVRRDILERVNNRHRTILDLAKPHEISLNAISKHVKKLESAGLIQRQVDGTFHRISLNGDALRSALEWMTHYVPFWHDNLQSLKADLEGQ